MSETCIDEIQQRLARLESTQAIRELMALYMQLCDVPSLYADVSALGELFTEDAIWEGVGRQYAGKFGRLEGVAAIVSMLERYLPPNPHFQLNGHFLASERILAEAGQGVGHWLMQQVSGYEDGRRELILARLQVDFRHQPEGWRISHFRTERLASFPLA